MTTTHVLRIVRPRTSPRKRSQAGFTLIEVLVALAVLAISLGVLLPVFSGVAKNQDALSEERTAIALAQSMLDGLGTEIPLADGSTEGVFSNGFGWSLSITHYQTSPADAQISSKMAILTVRWPGANGDHSLTVKATRLAGR